MLILGKRNDALFVIEMSHVLKVVMESRVILRVKNLDDNVSRLHTNLPKEVRINQYNHKLSIHASKQLDSTAQSPTEI